MNEVLTQTDKTASPKPEPTASEESGQAVASYGLLHPYAIASRMRRDKMALLGAFLVLGFVLVALVAPWISPCPPDAQDISRMNEAPFWWQPPSSAEPPSSAQGTSRHWMGLDVSGRDVLSRVLYGSRTSLLLGVAVVTLASLIGLTLGCVAGYFGGILDTLIMRTVDILLAFPFLILAIAIISIFPRTTLFHIALVLGLTSWPGICRLMRAQVMTTRELDFVKAAQALGSSHTGILFRHILPNCIAPVIIWFTLGIAAAVMAEASLSFLGFGQGGETLSWGSMIDSGLRKADFPSEWWPAAFPAAALALLVLAFNLLGDGLQDALNPRLKK